MDGFTAFSWFTPPVPFSKLDLPIEVSSPLGFIYSPEFTPRPKTSFKTNPRRERNFSRGFNYLSGITFLQKFSRLDTCEEIIFAKYICLSGLRFRKQVSKLNIDRA